MCRLRKHLEPTDLRTTPCQRHRPGCAPFAAVGRHGIGSLGRLRRAVATPQVDAGGEFCDVDGRKEILIEGSEPWSALEIVLSVPTPTSLRLDRLLSTELRLSRGCISKLARDERLRVAPERGHELRRSIADGTKISFNLGDAGNAWALGLGH